MKNIMLDLETMGSHHNSPIISIGAVSFGPKGLGEEFYKKISLQSSMQYGMRPDASTILWWLKQDEKVRGEFKDNMNEEDVKIVLDKFSQWCREQDEDPIMWGNGSDFDNMILASSYRMCEMRQSWGFYNNRCYRTLKNLFPEVKCGKNEGKHNALEDAKCQALHAVDILNSLNLMRK
jgi:3' exoribonuclease, RNase T-like